MSFKSKIGNLKSKIRSFRFRRLAVWVAPMKRRDIDLVDKQHAIEVIDLMLNDACGHSLQLENDLPAFAIECLDFDIHGSLHVAVQSGNTQAAFLTDLL